MEYCLSVKFVKSNKIYYFSSDNDSIKEGDFVVVETIVGKELGEVVAKPQFIDEVNFSLEIKPILRVATIEDIKMFNQSEELASVASKIFLEKVNALKLNMNLISSQYTLDKTKVLFTYVSEERVDFRELLKELASELHCRIELKQINPREKAQMVGGIGVCGLPLCCKTFLHKFEGVSLNRAKNQMLTINIPKLSGQCGKLMCCLNFEDELYTEERKKFPAVGTKFKYENEEFKVSSFNVLNKVIKCDSQDQNTIYLTLSEFNKLTK